MSEHMHKVENQLKLPKKGGKLTKALARDELKKEYDGSLQDRDHEIGDLKKSLHTMKTKLSEMKMAAQTLRNNISKLEELPGCWNINTQNNFNPS
ncbi:hypothetical protein DH2020_040505 [Rehmannia glutinosa]|uniref:Uncharacterized protein n=1 Tax=Rehmannia glutinosa TaxID=99300 RepID=A0ABR0USR5_REHGL